MEKHQQKDFYGPPNEDPFFALARDPLSDLSRKHRKTLMLVGTTTIAIALAGIVPRQFTTLGIELSPSDQRVLVWCMWFAVLYFLLSFILYALNDYWAWQANIGFSVRTFQESQSGQFALDEAVRGADIEVRNAASIRRWFRLRVHPLEFKSLALRYSEGKIGTRRFAWEVSRTIPLRMVWDYALPIIIGIVALIALLFWHPIRVTCA